MKNEKTLLVAVFRRFDPTDKSAKLERLLPLWDSLDHKEMAKVLANEDLWVNLADSCAGDISTTLPKLSSYTTICPAKITSKAFAEMAGLNLLLPSLTMLYAIDCPPKEKRYLFHCLSFFDQENGQDIFFSYNMDPTRTRVCVPMTDLKIPLVIPANKCELDYVPASLRLPDPTSASQGDFPERCPNCDWKLGQTPPLQTPNKARLSATAFVWLCPSCHSLFLVKGKQITVYTKSMIIG